MSINDKPGQECGKLSPDKTNREAQECLSHEAQDGMREKSLKSPPSISGNGSENGLRIDDATRERLFSAPFQNPKTSENQNTFDNQNRSENSKTPAIPDLKSAQNQAIIPGPDLKFDLARVPGAIGQGTIPYLDRGYPDRFGFDPDRLKLAPETVDGFRLKPYQENQPRLNLSIPGSYNDRPYLGREFGPLPPRPYEDLRQKLDRAITFDLSIGETPLEMTLNPRKCGLRTNAGLCFKLRSR